MQETGTIAWTIGELAERAADALGSDSRVNGRVREVPNERLIRWYTTIGLVDPPAARRGRVALYGRRHLLQLIAIKRRQGDGLSIAAIQAELAGAPDATLEAIARLPAPLEAAREEAQAELATKAETRTDTKTEPRAEPAAPDRRSAVAAGPVAAGPVAAGSRVRFWAATPRAGVPDGSMAVDTDSGLDAVAVADTNPIAVPAVDLVYGVRLAPGVTLMLGAGSHMPSREDTAALAEAARPLLDTIAALGLADPHPPRTGHRGVAHEDRQSDHHAEGITS